MFKGISSWFNNQRMGAKLGIGFGVLVTLAVLVGVAGFITENLARTATQSLQRATTEVTLLEEADVHVLSMRRNEKDFLLRYRTEGIAFAKSNYIGEHEAQLAELKADLATLRGLPNLSEDDLATLQLIEDQTDNYEASFTAVVSAIEIRGTSKSGGTLTELLESYRALANEAEGVGANEAAFETLAALDNLWSYIIYTIPGSGVESNEDAQVERQSRIDEIHQQNEQIKAAILSANLDSGDEAHLLTLLDAATSKFDQMTQVDLQIEQNMASARDAINQVHPVIDEYLTTQQADTDAEQAAFATTQSFVLATQIATVVQAVGIGIWLALLISNIITRQIGEIDRLFRAVGIGDFDQRAHVYSRDELGRTADGVNAMLARFTELLTEADEERAALQASVDRLVQEVAALAAGDLNMQAQADSGTPTKPIADALNYAVGELRMLVSGVEHAASGVTGASTTMTQVVAQMASQAANSAQVAEQAAQSAREGSRVVDSTIASMERIRENTQETATRMKRLGEASQEISEVVRFIEEIADRTTVLALNASIQAAAAGDAGRGFAVVAEEVQRLAERSTAATRQIENLVKGIQAETHETVAGIEEATREVVDGSELARIAGERMSELNALVSELAGLIENVAENTSQQTEDSVRLLASLSADLEQSVSAFRATTNGNGNGNGKHANGNGTRSLAYAS